MGEIGRDRLEFLYEMKWWEIRAIIRGYYRRHRDTWSATRWQTYYIMSAQIGSEAMHKSGINNPTDLLKFPWERIRENMPSDEEIASLQAEMAAINAANRK